MIMAQALAQEVTKKNGCTRSLFDLKSCVDYCIWEPPATLFYCARHAYSSLFVRYCRGCAELLWIPGARSKSPLSSLIKSPGDQLVGSSWLFLILILNQVLQFRHRVFPLKNLKITQLFTKEKSLPETII